MKNGIVFCNRKTEVDIVAKSLKTHGFDASPIHGDLDQATRTRTLESFRKGELKLLVASDVAARGLDIPAVSHVFNYDVPHHADDYVHRIGRTGRAGRTGETYMIVTPADSKSLDKVLKLIGKTPEMAPLDLDWSSLTDDRGRGGGRGAGGRDGRRSEPRPASRSRRPARDEGEQVAAAAPVVEAAPAQAEGPSTPEDRPKTRSRARTRARPDKVIAAEPATPEPVAPSPSPEPAQKRPTRQAERPIRGVKVRDEADEHRNGVRGFGGDTPAFLLRPTPTRND